jgi:hypothetical protein
MKGGTPYCIRGQAATVIAKDLSMRCHLWKSGAWRRATAFVVTFALAAAGCSTETEAPRSTHATAAATRESSAASFGRLPLRFEENRGQLDERVRFVARQGGAALLLTDDGAVLSLPQAAPASTHNPGARSWTSTPKSLAPTTSLKLTVRGGQSAKLEAGERLATLSNYFLGRDPAKWRTHVPSFREVAYRGVRPGVDLVFHGSSAGRLEYDLVVAPGVAPDVALDFEGADSVRVADDGALEIAVAGTVLRQLPPTVYQTSCDGRQEVAGRYRRVGKSGFAFSLDAYDATRPLVIDPVLLYSTYLGGGLDDTATGVATDGTGATYLAGFTASIDRPIANAIQKTNAGGLDAVVGKLNPQGDALDYITYLGGTNDDTVSGLAVDGTGAAVVVGTTLSTDFPVANALQGTAAANTGCTVDITGTLTCFRDAVIAKLTPAGDALVFSTYLGGSDDDLAKGVAVDSTHAAYVVGQTLSPDFPVINALQSASGSPGAYDAFVAKLTPSGSALVYSTYLGGADFDEAAGVAVDGTGAAYIVGQTGSSNFPRANAFQNLNGLNGFGRNAFVTKLTPAGNALAYSTYLGGSMGFIGDEADGVAVDGAGAAYVVGIATTLDFPLLNAIQPGFGGGGSDAFITKLMPAGNALAYSTYLGGSDNDSASSVVVDGTGAAVVVGNTASRDFPVANALQIAYAGATDAFGAKLTPDGSALVASTYFGGSGFDGANSVALDNAGAVHVAGSTSSNDFPVSHALMGALNGGDDAFVVKVGP